MVIPHIGPQVLMTELWRVRGKSVRLAAVIAAVTCVTLACSSSGSDSNSSGPPEQPDLVDLNDDMVLAQSSYPPIPNGDFRIVATRTMDDVQSPADNWGPGSWRTSGDQQVVSEIKTQDNAYYSVIITLQQKKVDLESWARDCLPYNTQNVTWERLDLPGLPDGPLAIRQVPDVDDPNVADDTDSYMAIGYVRDLFVFAYVGSGTDGMPRDAEADLVRIYTAQKKLLESY